MAQLRISKFTPCSIGLLPREGPKALTFSVTMNLLTDVNYSFDLTQAMQLNKISMIQGVYIDLTRLPSARRMTLTMLDGTGTQQSIQLTIGAGTVGKYAWIPIFIAHPCSFQLNIQSGPTARTVNFIFVNYPMANRPLVVVL